MTERRHKRPRHWSPYGGDDFQPRRDRSREHERRHHGNRKPPQSLPLGARELTKYDLPHYRPIFVLYLDVQKRLDIEELAEDEVKGRWKSFVNKWNRGELSEGWYDPRTLQKATQACEADTSKDSAQKVKPPRPQTASGGEDEDNDDFGPALPQTECSSPPRTDPLKARSGPTIPSLQDLQSRNDHVRSAAEAARDQRIGDTRAERKAERKAQKERLEEVAPRAEAGTRERQLEKKKDVAAAHRAFAASKDGGGDVEVHESDLMGEDTLSELKRMKRDQERRKTDREVRRDEIMRAKMADREERSQKLREKEEKTMTMLRELARARFGDGNERAATLQESDYWGDGMEKRE